jgi:hypothetical protein
MDGKDGRWGYLEEEGALKNMELGVVVVRDKVLHGHSLVYRDAKRDVLYSRHYLYTSCRCGKRGEVSHRQKGVAWESHSSIKWPNSTRRHVFLAPDSGFVKENKLAKGNDTSTCHSTRCYLSA